MTSKTLKPVLQTHSGTHSSLPTHLAASTTSTPTGYAFDKLGMHIASVIGLVLALSTVCVTMLYLSICWFHKRRRDREEILEVGRERFVKVNTTTNIGSPLGNESPVGVRESAF
jgi:hypothetical protein